MVVDVNTPPRLSIVIPVYNTEKYLPKCIDSILEQDFTDYELWLIDDGSKDGSIEVIKSYALKDSRIKTAFIKGTGPAMPRNYGLDHASGEYILFVDSDDYLPSGALRSLMNVTVVVPEVDFVKGNQFVLVENDIEARSVFAGFREPFAGKQQSGSDLLYNVLRTDCTPTNSLLRRSLIEKHHLRFHEELPLLEDVPFILEMCALSATCVYNSAETYVYRLMSETSLTRSKRTLGKVKSLVQVSVYEDRLKQMFDMPARRMVDSRRIEHAVSGLFQACTCLTRSESLEVLAMVASHYDRLPFHSRTPKHRIAIGLYNIHPRVAWWVLRLMRHVKSQWQ